MVAGRRYLLVESRPVSIDGDFVSKTKVPVTHVTQITPDSRYSPSTFDPEYCSHYRTES
jgi:hypothetical protein